MITKPYLEQLSVWPKSGPHILASYDEATICVYQAYNPTIASYAVSNQRFGDGFSYNRMSWIKPNFLWMMYRSGWASKAGQERILRIRLSRKFFDEVLRSAVASSYNGSTHSTKHAWELAVASSDVRLQWDPDHDPAGRSLERRAVQLGLRGTALRRYGESEAVSIEDVTSFVIEQRGNCIGDFKQLSLPEERVYHPNSVPALGSN